MHTVPAWVVGVGCVFSQRKTLLYQDFTEYLPSRRLVALGSTNIMLEEYGKHILWPKRERREADSSLLDLAVTSDLLTLTVLHFLLLPFCTSVVAASFQLCTMRDTNPSPLD